MSFLNCYKSIHLFIIRTFSACEENLSSCKYKNGKRSWNGKTREATVDSFAFHFFTFSSPLLSPLSQITNVCGPVDLLRAVDEPEICAYTAVHESPCFCTEGNTEFWRKEVEKGERMTKDEMVEL
jgi:hypothetical protein